MNWIGSAISKPPTKKKNETTKRRGQRGKRKGNEADLIESFEEG